MGTTRFAESGVLLLALQALAVVFSQEQACVPGFKTDTIVFEVERRHLEKGRILGKVGFGDCTSRKLFVFNSEDTCFRVEHDGKLKVNRRVTLHEGHRNFFIHGWDSQGRKMTALVRVLLQAAARHHAGDGHRHHQGSGRDNGENPEHDRGPAGHHNHHQGNHHNHKTHEHNHDGQAAEHHQHHHRNHHSHNDKTHEHHHGGQSAEHHQHHHGNHHNNKTSEHHHSGQEAEHLHHQGNHHNQQDQSTESDSANKTKIASSQGLPVLHFPKSSGGLRRSKRAWVIPPISFSENHNGPFPTMMVQIRSDADKEVRIQYRISGPGADEDPLGIFFVDRNTGWLYVTQRLDREKQSKYMLKAHALKLGSGDAEAPMDIIVNVIDQNDNKPIFTKEIFAGEVPEVSPIGYEVTQVSATDLDEPNNLNSDIRYSIISQDPVMPADNLFTINPINGVISVNAAGLDREKYPKYTLVVQAADMAGEGLTGQGRVEIAVIDSNDNAPVFEQSSYEARVKENQVGVQVAKMSVTDGDEPHSPAWRANFSIVGGDNEGYFKVETGPNKQEGIITTAKGLDFEKISKYTLLVAVVNEIPFAKQLATATATVIVNVEDVNEAPIFNPVNKLVVKREDLTIGSDLVQYTATDPDTARKQKVSYKIASDLAGWLSIGKDTGLIKVKAEMDRESHFVVDNKYKALIAAYDDDEVPATGTGTLVIQLEDVNDNFPTIDKRAIKVCNKESQPQLLSVIDKDGPGFSSPFTVSLHGTSKTNWTARMNDNKTGIILTLGAPLPSGEYSVLLRVADNHGLAQDSTLQATVCECTGAVVACVGTRVAAAGLPLILGILGAVLLLLLLVLLLLMFLRRRGREKKEPLLPEDDIRDNIYYYDEEGGGEDDQDYDLSVLHRGLDNRPEVFRNDVVPNFMPAPQYRPRPANPEDIGNFIDDNLKAADNDPTAPPYDSLLVFDYEGGGSDAGSLSSLNSSSSGDQDYSYFNEWGPRFKKLADMYGGGDDDDDDML
ncbi:cadherin-1-like [Lampris incognitus]|uniref:cadherin-1-like n=1 Tax=Lampris incognitus TaxID=2546036 RepID=UPI0024B635AD|nr:cadherin-1-like [Lampris incognitus]